MNNDQQVPDFILNLQEDKRKRNIIDNPEQNSGIINNSIDFNSSVPDFILNMDSNQNSINLQERQDLNYKDVALEQELGISLDRNWDQDSEQVKQYIDSLSKEDYKTWENLKNEGYSLNARKALFDNRDDLYDISEPGNKKFWSGNKNSFMESLLQQQQDVIDFQQDVIHPRSETAQDWLDVQAADLMNYKFEDIYYEKYQDMLDTDNKLLQTVKRAAVLPDSLIKRGAAVAGGLLFDLAGKTVNLVDNLGNISSQFGAWGLNTLADDKKGYDLVVSDPSKEPNIFGSYVEAVGDTLGMAFTVKYPLATRILSVLGTENDWVGGAMEAMNDGIKGVYKRIDSKTGEDQYLLKNLTPEEIEQYYDNKAMATFIVFSALMGEGYKSMTKTEAYQRYQQARNIAKETSKIGLREGIKEVKDTKTMMGSQPEGTELKTKGGSKIMETTPNGVKTTFYGNLRILQKLLGRQFNGYKRGFEWARDALKNKNKLVTRNPNTPVGELPVIETPDMRNKSITEKPVEGIGVKEEPIKDEIKTNTEVKTTESKPVVKPIENGNTSIGEYIRKISNDITGKRGGMDQTLLEKFKTSKDLQNEYVNTIDPYIRANGTENPSEVIREQLSDFVDTMKEQLQDRRNKNIDFRKGQMKYKVELPETEKALREKENKDIKDLIKVLSREQTNSEKFLKYLLNLPEEKVETLKKYIPDYEKNIGLINDTLNLTKAITSSDLLGKFLQFKSTFGTRNKNFIRKYLYKRLNEAYKKAGIKRNMYEIENILNQMSEEELITLEKEMETGELRAFDSEAEFNDLLEKGYMPDTWKPANQNLEEIMNSKWPGTNKTTREYLKEKGVQLSVTNERGLRKIGGNVQAAYSARLDRILMKTENNPYKGIVYHEFGHRVLSQLGTTQIMDIISHIAKRDNITQEAAFERRAEYFRNYLEYNNVDGKKYLIKNLGEDITSKINATMEKTKEEIWDLFDLDDGDRNINQILSDVKHDTPKGQDITSRRPEPLVDDMIGDAKPVRYEYLRTIDPNIESVQIYPYFDKPLEIKFNDGTTQRWSEYRKTLTPEQLKEVDTYETDFIQEYVDEMLGKDKGFKGEGKFDYDTLQNEKDLTNILMDETMNNIKSIQKDFGLDALESIDFLNQFKSINPDIVGVVEKNGEIYLKVLEESFWERYEQSDRPGQRELRTVKADDYLTEEDMNKFSPEIQEKLKFDTGLYQGGEGGLQYSEGKNLKLGNGYYFGSKKQAKEFGPSILRLEKGDWKFYEPKDTQSYQVEASKNGGKEAFNKKLQEEGYDGIKAYNEAFQDYEYNFFSNPFE